MATAGGAHNPLWLVSGRVGDSKAGSGTDACACLTHAALTPAPQPPPQAPEVLEGGHATAASDVFSFGVCLWELATWRLPWAGVPPLRIIQLVTRGQRPELPPLGDLPGTSTADAASLEAYCQLMRCAGAAVVAEERWLLAMPPLSAPLSLLASPCPPCSSECWAQVPADRPSMDSVVRRLRGLLEQAGAAP